MSPKKTPVQRPLTRAETKQALQGVTLEGVASQTMESLTTGVFMVGIALHLGASNFVIGFLGSIPFLSNLFQIPAIHLVDKYRNRKVIVVTACYVARSFLILVAFLPLVSSKEVALGAFVFFILMRYCVGAMATCAWNSWVRDLVPRYILGKFFGRRMFFTTGVGTLFGLGAAQFIDWWEAHFPGDEIYSYATLYTLGFIAGMVSTTLILTMVHHPPMPALEAQQFERNLSLARLKVPFRNENFRKLMAFLVAWNFAVNLAAPFFTVYMLKTLDYDMTLVMAITLISQAVNVLSLRVWGRYSDHFSNKTVLGICGPLFIFCILGWTFTTFPEKHALTLPLLIVLHVLMGIAISGVTLSTNNIALKLAPRENATPYLAMNTVLSSLAAGIAPLVGGLFADFFESKMLSFDIRWQDSSGTLLLPTLVINHWDFFFVMAFVIGIYALHRLSLVSEDGAVGERVAIREMMLDTGRVLRTLSTVDGLRALTMTPLAMTINMIRRRK